MRLRYFLVLTIADVHGDVADDAAHGALVAKDVHAAALGGGDVAAADAIDIDEAVR